jgi:hypothetical protein
VSDTTIKVGIDPKAAQKALQDIANSAKELSAAIEEAMGKDIPKQFRKTEDEAENAANKIGKYFRNLSSRVKEDLKAAFDLGSVMQGMKFANELGSGIKQVFEMERAFDRLNTRLMLSNSQMTDFKRNVGRAVSATGQKLEDVLPGVETAAAKGGVKSPQQLTAIAESLGKARAITGEGTEGLSDSIVEILKAQGKKVNAGTFRETMDTLQATRANGAFHTAGEAGSAVAGLAPYAQKLGMNTRDLGGMAAMASQSGAGGMNILQQLMEKGTTVGGQQQINAALGQKVFKNGKLDSSALGKVNTERFGQYSQQVLQEATGLSGANGADLKRFVESFKNGQDALKKVVNGSNETANQFDVASDNLSTKLDMFKEKTKEAAREVGEELSKAANSLLKGQAGEAGSHLGSAGKNLWDNKGTVLAALGVTAGVGMLAGRGANNMLKKIGGGAVKGLVGGELAKAAGATPVYVVNAAEIGGGGLGDAAGAVGGGLLGKIGGVAGKAGLVGAAGVAGYGIGMGINKITGNTGQVGEWLYNKTLGRGELQQGANDPEDLKKAIVEGVVEGTQKAKMGTKTNFTNPSDMSGNRGGGM